MGGKRGSSKVIADSMKISKGYLRLLRAAQAAGRVTA